MKKVFFLIGGAILVFFAASDGLEYYRAYRSQDATPAPTPTPLPSTVSATGTPEPIGNGNISVSAPGKYTNITLPFTVSGSARVFENTVTIVLKDTDGNELYHDFTTAQPRRSDFSEIKEVGVPTETSGSPDTGQLGPFTKTITYLQKPPASSDLTLEVFWNSPKDGEPLDIVSIPLVFNGSGARSTKVFFSNHGTDPSAACSTVYPVLRLTATMQAPVTSAIEQLLKGPTPEELREGYTTAIPSNIEMPRIAVSQGTATVDFKEDIFAYNQEPCILKTIYAQIERTLYQFPNISGAVISVEGRKKIFP
ncbi:MAG: Gmad2 immunoglobulin-like domain-containing protein [bacterium]|nr:Gmad2 immunoglobulin-like domain-containing protein [bacterium]